MRDPGLVKTLFVGMLVKKWGKRNPKDLSNFVENSIISTSARPIRAMVYDNDEAKETGSAIKAPHTICKKGNAEGTLLKQNVIGGNISRKGLG